jgi:ADP-ribose pyrophosphatase YjhB (NUDIX family)
MAGREILSAEKEREGEPKRIARTVLVAPIPVADLLLKLGTLKAPEDIHNLSFVEVALIKKSSQSKASEGLVMPVGGQVEPHESMADGALREVAKEVTVTAFSESTPRRIWGSQADTFTYFAPGYRKARVLSIFVLPVQARSFSMHKAREREGHPDSEDKIEKVVHLSPSEMREFVQRGTLEKEGENLRAAGLLSPSAEDSIEISNEEKGKRGVILDRVLSEVVDFDRRLKEATLDDINELRRIRKRLPAHDLADCDPDEISRGFVGAQLRMSLADETDEERVGRHHKKMSLLRALPYFASSLPAAELTHLLYSVPNREGRQAAVQIERAFTRGAEIITSALEDKEDSVSGGQTVFDRETTTNKLLEIWPQFLNLPAGKRADLLRSADQEATREIIRVTGAIEIDVFEALRVVDDFHDVLAGEMRAAGLDAFQEYRPMNELSNARIFPRVLYALGLHPNTEVTALEKDELRTLRFEALRSLVVFNVALEAARQIREANNDVFQAGVDSFFSFPPTSEMMDLGDGKLHPVYYRTTRQEIRGKPLHMIVDERPKKTTVSATRKLFLSEELNDIFSINFVLADDNFADSVDPIGDRLAAAESLGGELLEHVRNVAGPDWEVFMMDGKRNRKVIDQVSSIGVERDFIEASVQEISGKRPGSSGDAIIRDKFILCLKGPNGESEKIEVNIYPFQSVRSNGLEVLQERNFWGFVEKLDDDYKGEYKAKRILSRDSRLPTKPSLYELLYPSRFYKRQADAAKEKHVRRRSRRPVDSD